MLCSKRRVFNSSTYYVYVMYIYLKYGDEMYIYLKYGDKTYFFKHIVRCYDLILEMLIFSLKIGMTYNILRLMAL